MKKGPYLVVLFLLFTAPVLAEDTFYFPLIGDGTSGTIRFQTRLVLVNTGGETTVEIAFFDQQGNPLPLSLKDQTNPVSSLDISLKLGETFSTETTGTGTLQVGYACVTDATGVQAGSSVVGTAVFTRADVPSGVTLYTAAVPASGSVTDFSVFVDTVGSKNTGLAILNPPSMNSLTTTLGREPAGQDNLARVALKIYDKSFDLLDETIVELPEGSLVSKFTGGEFFPGLPENVGSVTGESDRPVVVVALLQDDDGNPFPQSVANLAPFRVEPARAAQTPVSDFTVNTQNREEVVEFFQTTYQASETELTGFTGDVDACEAGTISKNFKEALLRRINFFRAMAGLRAGVSLDEGLNAKCQEAALMMLAERSLSHFPDTSWACYSNAGAEAAEKSNLSLAFVPKGRAQHIDLFMADPGAINFLVGHRRWILDPRQDKMGAGYTEMDGTVLGPSYFEVLSPSVATGRASVDAADVHGPAQTGGDALALWVIGPFGPREETPNGVPYPPAGNVPYQIVYERWSFSLADANFDNATVTMSENGNPLSLNVEELKNDQEFGDNTIVWVPQGMPLQQTGIIDHHAGPSGDVTYTVMINNVMVNNTPRNFTYEVTVIDAGQ